jgi:hypothetical protein
MRISDNAVLAMPADISTSPSRYFWFRSAAPPDRADSDLTGAA